MRLLVTGATGFVGRAFTGAAETAGHEVVRAVRHLGASSPPRAVAVGEINTATDWRAALIGAETVVHLAARVHMMRDTAADPLAAFRAVNVDGTVSLARQAAAAGARRFVFVSSIKVNGEASPGRPLTEEDPPDPRDSYGFSKFEAEQELGRVGHETGLEVVVVRPVLVYGPGAGGSLRRLLQVIARGIPLPLGAVSNRRNLVGVESLSSLLLAAVASPRAAGEVFLAAEEPALSTASLVRVLADGAGRPVRLVAVPPSLLRLGGRVTGTSAAVERLLGSLEVDPGKAKRLLGWRGEAPLEVGLRAMAAAFMRPSATR